MDREAFARGLELRRAVLGSEYVNRALEKSGDIAAGFQQLVTEYCWGSVWTRTGLSRRDRSLVTVAILVALNRLEELRLHLQGALRNGCSREEIGEVLLHTAVYCGVPAAADAFRIARDVLRGTEPAGGD